MKNIIRTRIYESPCGSLLLGSYDDMLCLCDWLAEKHHDRVRRRLERLLNAAFEEEASPVTEEAARQLDEYFAGRRRAFDLPLLFAGTEFQKAVSGRRSPTAVLRSASVCRRLSVRSPMPTARILFRFSSPATAWSAATVP